MLILISLIILLNLNYLYGHGRMMEPPARNTMWKLNFIYPPAWDDAELFCGGIKVQHSDNGGKCGICGDAFNAKYKHFETGGKMARNITSRVYSIGSNFTTIIEIVANHGGIFTFQMCYRESFDIKETEDCFEQIKLSNGDDYFRLNSSLTLIHFPITLSLPKDKSCEACVFRWNWVAGNNWGKCDDGKEKVGCGPQETWRNCADVKVSNEKGIRGPHLLERAEENLQIYHKYNSN